MLVGLPHRSPCPCWLACGFAGSLMECRKYVDCYLTAHADGELTRKELCAAAEHVDVCARCHERFGEEKDLKELLRRRLGMVQAPPGLRVRTERALARAARGSCRSGAVRFAAAERGTGREG